MSFRLLILFDLLDSSEAIVDPVFLELGNVLSLFVWIIEEDTLCFVELPTLIFWSLFNLSLPGRLDLIIGS